MMGLKNLPEKIFCGEVIILPVHVDGRKPRGFKCENKGLLRSKCSLPQKVKVNEKEMKPEGLVLPAMETAAQQPPNRRNR